MWIFSKELTSKHVFCINKLQTLYHFLMSNLIGNISKSMLIIAADKLVPRKRNIAWIFPDILGFVGNTLLLPTTRLDLFINFCHHSHRPVVSSQGNRRSIEDGTFDYQMGKVQFHASGHLQRECPQDFFTFNVLR